MKDQLRPDYEAVERTFLDDGMINLHTDGTLIYSDHLHFPSEQTQRKNPFHLKRYPALRLNRIENAPLSPSFLSTAGGMLQRTSHFHTFRV